MSPTKPRWGSYGSSARTSVRFRLGSSPGIEVPVLDEGVCFMVLFLRLMFVCRDRVLVRDHTGSTFSQAALDYHCGEVLGGATTSSSAVCSRPRFSMSFVHRARNDSASRCRRAERRARSGGGDSARLRWSPVRSIRHTWRSRRRLRIALGNPPPAELRSSIAKAERPPLFRDSFQRKDRSRAEGAKASATIYGTKVAMTAFEVLTVEPHGPSGSRNQD